MDGDHKQQTNIHIQNFVRADPLPTPPTTEHEPVVLVTPRDVELDSLDNILPPALATAPIVAEAPSVPAPSKDDHAFGMPGSKAADGTFAAVETINGNVQLKRFRARATDAFDLTVDVEFLRNVIKVLIANHHITTTPKDLQDILQYYGDDVEVRVNRQPVLTRSVKKAGMCCSADDIREFVDVVDKVLVGGVNIAKRVPAFVDFLHSLQLM